jgi:phosphatidylethanolamine-binding protein (PEBP) family uncharacterized protein
MDRMLNMMIVSGTLMLTLALAGCGGSGSTSQSSSTPASSSSTPASASQTTSTATTGTQTSGSAPGNPGNAPAATTSAAPQEHLPKVTLLVSSPTVPEGSPISAQYTCDGADTSLPVQWKAIPHGTAELALFVLNLETPSGGKPLVYWAVAGLRPALKGISAGTLPRGAIVGRNSLGQSRYTICPAKSDGVQHYVVALFALQHRVSATPGFNADAFYKAVSNAAEHKGLFGFSYQRR